MSDLEKAEVPKWLEKVHRYAWLESRIEYHKKQLEKTPGDTSLKDNISLYEDELQELGNPNDSVPEALKKPKSKNGNMLPRAIGRWL